MKSLKKSGPAAELEEFLHETASKLSMQMIADMRDGDLKDELIFAKMDLEGYSLPEIRRVLRGREPVPGTDFVMKPQPASSQKSKPTTDE